MGLAQWSEPHSSLVCPEFCPRSGLHERVNQIVYAGVGVSLRERWQIETKLDQLENRYRFVLAMINESRAGERRNDDCWHAHTSAPAIGAHRRSNMVPAPTVFVISN